MCDRKDQAMDHYNEALAIINFDNAVDKISDRLYANMLLKLNLLKEDMGNSDYRSFQKDVYDVLNMQEDCDKCLLPPSEDCEICNWTQVNEIKVFDVITVSEDLLKYNYYTNIMK